MNQGADEGPDVSEQVGSLAEEAVKLAAAFADWARSGAGASAATRHLATGSEECTVCPICQVLHIVKGSRPEVFDHLRAAAFSLALATRAALDPDPPGPDGRRGPVENIEISLTETDG